eukprot:6199687-Pleurochrysis_carterae.AAC.2
MWWRIFLWLPRHCRTSSSCTHLFGRLRCSNDDLPLWSGTNATVRHTGGRRVAWSTVRRAAAPACC